MSDSTTKSKVLKEKDYTGKLPPELIQELMMEVDEFNKLLKESEQFDLQIPHMLELLWEEPFFGALSRRIQKIRTCDIPTAGVTIKEHGLIQMLWNPIFFWKTLEGYDTNKSRPKIRGLMKHELYHIIFEHVTHRRRDPFVLWNAATDCAINSLIPRGELPDCGLIPGELYIPEEFKPKVDKKGIQETTDDGRPVYLTPDKKPYYAKEWSPPPLLWLISNAPLGESSEWYMELFLQDSKIQEAIESAKQTAEKSCSTSNNKSDNDQSKTNSSFNRSFNKALEDELYGDGGAGQVDSHDLWDDMSDEQRDVFRDYVRDIFRDCVREAESRANGWGTIPASVQTRLKKIISNIIDWRDLLNQFIGKSKSTKTTSSIKRINRRYPWIHPGRKRSYSAKPAIAIDQSGSMSDEWISLFFGELNNLGGVVEYDILPFDVEVDLKSIQHVRRGQVPNLERVRCGGTDFSVPIQYVNQQVGVYDCLIIMTDGMCNKPVKCDIPLVYVLAPDCEMLFDSSPVQVIKMTDTRKDK